MKDANTHKKAQEIPDEIRDQIDVLSLHYEDPDEFRVEAQAWWIANRESYPKVDEDAVEALIDGIAKTLARDQAEAAQDAGKSDPESEAIRKELRALLGLAHTVREKRLRALAKKHGATLSALKADFKSVQAEASTNDDEALKIAEIVRSADFNNDDVMSLDDGAFWTFSGHHWQRRSRDYVRAAVADRMRVMGCPWADKTFSVLRNEAYGVLRDITFRGDDPLRFLQALPNVLCLLNGELPLSGPDKGKLLPHDPRSYLRVGLNVAYDPNATCPTFEKVVHDAMLGDGEMVRHLEEVLALAMSPKKPFAAYIVFAGTGSNAKGSVKDVFEDMLGEASISLRLAELEGSRFSMGDLVGRSAVIDDDLDTDEPLPIALLKKISEHKKLRGEVKYGNRFDFFAAVTPLLLVNEYPPLKDTSYGAVRRCNVIPFRRQFTMLRDAPAEAERLGFASVESAVAAGKLTLADLSLPGKLAEEKPGILNRLLAALDRLLQRRGFDEPTTCSEARREWRREADSVQGFLAAESLKSDDYRGVRLSEFKVRYFAWCEHNRLRPKGVTKIAAALGNAGYVISKSEGVDFVRGIKLRPVTQL